MQRYGIVDRGTYLRLGQSLPELIAIRHANDVEMINRVRVHQFERQYHGGISLGQQLGVPLGSRAALKVPLREVPQFHPQESGLDRIKPSVIALDVVVVLLPLSMISDHSNFARHIVAVGGYGAGLATRPEIL